MKKEIKIVFLLSFTLLIGFIVWTMLILSIDVAPVGVNDTLVGFSSLNTMVHSFIGVHMILYDITDWLGLVPLFVCCIFALIGLNQFIKRKNIFKVDTDIILLGFYYMTVIIGYLIFEIYPINYRPILINGCMEASYPSSTTLLVLSVMPTLILQLNSRYKNKRIHKIVKVSVILFCIFMVLGRIISGVHWITDIIGSILLSSGLFHLYKGFVLLLKTNDNEFGG